MFFVSGKSASLREACNAQVLMGRWSKPRKPRAKEMKPRRTRKAETKPRKLREVTYVPIAAPGDLKGLAKTRKECSPVLLKRRLASLDAQKLSQYANHAHVSLRTAQRDRKGQLRPGQISSESQQMLLVKWEELVKERSGSGASAQKAATHADVESYARSLGIKISKSALGRLLKGSGVKKPRVPQRGRGF